MGAETASSTNGAGRFLRTWGTLAAVTVVMFTVSLDAAMLPVAIEPITKDLGTTTSGVQSALSIYSIVNAPLLLTGAALGTFFGNKRVYIVGIVLFAIGTLVGAFAPSIGIFVLGWSVIKGIADTLITPVSLALLLITYEGKQRTTAFGVWGGVTASAQAIGPLLMGYLATAATWRWAIALESVILVLGLALMVTVSETERRDGVAFDWQATVLAFFGIGSLITGFLLAGRYGWFTPRRPFVVFGTELAPFGLSVVPFVFMVGFVVLWGLIELERRRSALGKSVLFDPMLLTNRVYVTGLSIYGLYNVVTTGFGFVLPTFLALAAGFDPLTIGVAFLPFAIATIASSLASGRIERYLAPKRMIQLSIVLFIVGLLWLGTVMTGTVTLLGLAVPLFVFGAGAGLMRGPTSNLSLTAAGGDQGGEASGVLETGKEFGRGFGNAVVGTVFLTGLYGGIVDGLLRAGNITVPPGQREQLIVELEDAAQTFSSPESAAAFAQLPDAVQSSLNGIVLTAATDAFQLALVVVIGIVLLQLILSGFLPTKEQEPKQPDTDGEAISTGE